MARDIQIIRLLDVLDVTSVSILQGVVPRSVNILGRDFRNVEQVLLNGFDSTEFVVMGTTRLIAQVPDEIATEAIRDVFVLSNTLTFTDRSLVEFTFGTRPRAVSGVLRLMQTFIRMLFRTPGSNVFRRHLGGGLRKHIGSTIGQGQGNRSRVAGEVSIAITRTRQQIINVQAPDRSIPPSERLAGAELTALTVDPPNGQLSLTVQLTSYSGQRAAATLVT